MRKEVLCENNSPVWTKQYLADIYNEEKTVCSSTEELLAEVEELNENLWLPK